MQLIVRHKTSPNHPLVLPIDYHYILQSMIYDGLRDEPEFCDFMHNRGYGVGKRTYKLFTFSLLKGKRQISERTIMFDSGIELEIRSVDAFMLTTLAEFFRTHGIAYAYKNQRFTDVEVILKEERIEAEELLVKMASPITVYSTDAQKKTFYYAPADDRFRELVNSNFKRKYEAYFGEEPNSDIWIEPFDVTRKDNYVTTYKNLYIINGWKGEYFLAGNKEHLNFLYHCGLGGKNSQGFGMFNVIDIV